MSSLPALTNRPSNLSNSCANSRPLLPMQEEAWARLQFALEHRHPLTLLVGPAGTGKSLLLRRILSEQKLRGSKGALLSLQGMTRTSLLWFALAELGLNPPRDATEISLLRQWKDSVRAWQLQGKKGLLLLDDFQTATSELFSLLPALIPVDDPENPLTVVLAADSGALSRIPNWWLERAQLRAQLDPLPADEISDMLPTADNRADGSQASPESDPTSQSLLSSFAYTEDGLQTLHGLSQGLPRRIEQLHNLVQIAAEGSSSAAPIDGETIDQVYRELYVHPRR